MERSSHRKHTEDRRWGSPSASEVRRRTTGLVEKGGSEKYGGEGGIRTPGSLATTSDFESGAFNRALPPLRICLQLLSWFLETRQCAGVSSGVSPGFCSRPVFVEGIHGIHCSLVNLRHKMRITHCHLDSRMSRVQSDCRKGYPSHHPTAAGSVPIVVPVIVLDPSLFEGWLEPVRHIGHPSSFGVEAQRSLGLLAFGQLLVGLDTLLGKWDIANLRPVPVLLLVNCEHSGCWLEVANAGSELLRLSHASVRGEDEQRDVVREPL